MTPENMGNYLYFDVEQGSDTWFQMRKGIPTCSEFSRILTGTGKISDSCEDYICELVGEKYSDIPPEGVESFTSRAMQWGQQMESEARRWYTMNTGHKVRNGGFVTSLDGRFGGSPDGLIESIGGIELKCPQAKAHVSYCLKGILPLKFRPQVHGALWITGALWWDFVSYCRGLPPFRIRVEPDEYTEKLGKALEEFHARYLEIEAKVMQEGET